jgi:hypothetical protein
MRWPMIVTVKSASSLGTMDSGFHSIFYLARSDYPRTGASFRVRFYAREPKFSTSDSNNSGRNHGRVETGNLVSSF